MAAKQPVRRNKVKVESNKCSGTWNKWIEQRQRVYAVKARRSLILPWIVGIAAGYHFRVTWLTLLANIDYYVCAWATLFFKRYRENTQALPYKYAF
jgi:hypothetical protein